MPQQSLESPSWLGLEKDHVLAFNTHSYCHKTAAKYINGCNNTTPSFVAAKMAVKWLRQQLGAESAHTHT